VPSVVDRSSSNAHVAANFEKIIFQLQSISQSRDRLAIRKLGCVFSFREFGLAGSQAVARFARFPSNKMAWKSDAASG